MTLSQSKKTNPKRTQFQNRQNERKCCFNKGLRKKRLRRRGKNKPNSNPIQSQNKPNSSPNKPNPSPNKPNQSQFKPNFKPPTTKQTQSNSKRSADPYGCASWNPRTGDPIAEKPRRKISDFFQNLRTEVLTSGAKTLKYGVSVSSLSQKRVL